MSRDDVISSHLTMTGQIADHFAQRKIVPTDEFLEGVRRKLPCGAGASASRRHPDDDDLHAPGAPGSAESREPVRREERRCTALGISIPSYPGPKSFAENFNKIEMVAPTGFVHWWAI